MLEVIWHARGGQGAFTAARCLGAAAALSAGKCALAFPTFGPERRGAPMRAFTKIADEPIGDRSAVARAQLLVYLDETLLADGWDAELAPGGLMLLNSRHGADDPRVVAIDADGISAAVLGRPIPNTVFLGAIPALCDAVSLHDVHEGIRATMPEKLHERNIAIVDAAFEELTSRDDLPRVGGLGERAGESGTELFDLATAVLLEGEGGDAL
ncbi:2-oxoacid:acceptor oxidoreductase family protein [Adlercreutzia sp. R21]|uniref:2-oxoacid:acceptor oxidoreductase family protein n=1 Tax=Adlercreutzia wanghongyangiae TaxID=3111451 RepID=UPI002DB5D969|nr:2-oxoacid:acceptor oxidoreductase family protein [Adlercreutzia sp. R21]MEC4183466.1 2-oxoacid:acceptor oxidoreductase family protein [Adlercreutzia sp. R21]